MTTGILDLPSELIAQTFEYLDDKNVFEARLSHRALERSSLAHFGKRFFRKRGFMITTQSLDVLQEIAQHDQLKKYVQHVWFNPDCYTFARPECCPDEEEDKDLDSADELETPLEKEPVITARIKNRLAEQYDAYRWIVSDHSHLLHSGKLEAVLTSIFSLLPNLQTIGMRRSEDYGPYGWRDVKRAVGEDPRILGPIPNGPGTALSGPTQLFSAIISALATTGTRLERLYTDAIELDNIPEGMLTQAKLDAACSSILYIELNVIKGWLTKHPVPESQTYNPLFETAAIGNGVVRLFSATRNLKEVGLQVFRDKKQSYLVPPVANNPESWIASYPYMAFQKLVTKVSLPHLTRIKLEKITTSPKILQDFLRPCASKLTSLKIRDIRLLSSAENPLPWKPVFAFLSETCPELDYILLYHLMHDSGGVSFTSDPPQVVSELIEHPINLSSFYTRHAQFTDYEQITLETTGKQEVKVKLEELQEKHWYHRPLFSYAMDEDVWHTDTSDEEW